VSERNNPWADAWGLVGLAILVGSVCFSIAWYRATVRVAAMRYGYEEAESPAWVKARR
jgi:hypothetical protein